MKTIMHSTVAGSGRRDEHWKESWREALFFKALRLIASESYRLWFQDQGQDLVEYGLLIFLVALAAIASMKGLASSISTLFKSAATSLTTTS